MNNQRPEKRLPATDYLLQVHSIFHTIQGEGPFCGTPAVFVRLAGCNLQCPGCDTEYTSTRRHMNANTILSHVRQHMSRGLVVITGGEPFRQNLWALINSLNAAGYYVQVETNGTMSTGRLPTGLKLWRKDVQLNHRAGAYIVCSPKTGSVNPDMLKLACCFKYVLDADDMDPVDGLPLHALGHSADPHLFKPPVGSLVYLQPMDSLDPVKNKRNLDACIQSCMRFGYVLQLQVHKIINME